MNLSAPITASTRGPAWVAAAKAAMRDSIIAYRRAVGLSALGLATSDDWASWTESLATAIMYGLAGGIGHAQAEIDRAEPTTQHAANVRIVDDPDRSEFSRGIRALESAVVRSGASMDSLRDKAQRIAEAISGSERMGGTSRLVRRLQAVIESQEKSFWSRGFTEQSVRPVREIITGYMRDIGRDADSQQYAGYSDAIKRVQQQLSVTDNRADTIVRTNVLRANNSAHAARLDRPEVRRVIPLVILVEIHDTRTRGAPGGIYRGSHRDNPGWHWEMDGLVGTIEQFRAWGVIPPNGYRCRGSIRGLNLAECEEMGFLDAETMQMDFAKIDRHNGERLTIIRRGLYPDPGFKRSGLTALAA